jgi:hypothetical protein
VCALSQRVFQRQRVEQRQRPVEPLAFEVLARGQLECFTTQIGEPLALQPPELAVGEIFERRAAPQPQRSMSLAVGRAVSEHLTRC